MEVMKKSPGRYVLRMTRSEILTLRFAVAIARAKRERDTDAIARGEAAQLKGLQDRLAALTLRPSAARAGSRAEPGK